METGGYVMIREKLRKSQVSRLFSMDFSLQFLLWDLFKEIRTGWIGMVYFWLKSPGFLLSSISLCPVPSAGAWKVPAPRDQNYPSCSRVSASHLLLIKSDSSGPSNLPKAPLMLRKVAPCCRVLGCGFRQEQQPLPGNEQDGHEAKVVSLLPVSHIFRSACVATSFKLNER